MTTKVESKNGRLYIDDKEIIFEALKNEKCSIFLNLEDNEVEEFLSEFENRFPETMIITSEISEGIETFYATYLNDRGVQVQLDQMYWEQFIGQFQIIVYLPDIESDGSLAKLDVILRGKFCSSHLFGDYRMIFINTKAEEYVKFCTEIIY